MVLSCRKCLRAVEERFVRILHAVFTGSTRCLPQVFGWIRYYPSKEEAEYTACLAFVSLWAVRMGFGI